MMLERPRVLDALDQPHRIMVVRAPAGAGKSVALRHWRDRQAEAHTIWLTAERSLDSRARFWGAVLDAIFHEDPADPRHAQARARLEGDTPVARVIAPLLPRNRDTVLIVDAFEQLGDLQGEISEGLLVLVEQAYRLRLIVAGRTPTPFTTTAVRLRHDVGEIGNADLLFTIAEIRELLAEEAVPQTDTRLPDLLERVTGHGFAIAVRAAVLALQSNRALAAAPEETWKRIVAEDFQHAWSEELLEFVLRTSAAPYFDRELAAQLSGLDHDEELLRWLEAEGFGEWEALPSGVPAFRYTYPIRTVFRDELRRVGGPDSALYRRNAAAAAAWLHTQGDADGALELAVEARDWRLASQICQDHLTGVNFFSLELREQRRRFLERVPDGELKKWPVLALMLALIYNADPVTRGRGARLFAQAMISTRASGRSVLLGERVVSRGIISSSLRVMGRVALAGTSARNTLELLRQITPEQRESLATIFPVATRQVATSLLVAGHPDLAVEANEMGIADVTGSRELVQNNYTLSQAAGLHAILGNDRRASQALASINPAYWPTGAQDGYPNALGIIAEAFLSLDEFRYQEADATLARLDPHLDTIEFWPRITQLHMHAALGLGLALDEARRVEAALEIRMPGTGSRPEAERLAAMHAILWLAAGRPGKALAILAKGRLPVVSGTARALHHMVTGDSEKALDLVTRVLQHADISVRDSASLSLVGAAASLRLGDRRTASHLLSRAAHAYEVYGPRAHMLFLPAQDREHLAEMARNSHSATMDELFAGTELVPSPMPFLIGGPRLTRRELVVVNALARTETIAELADALAVSPNTLKAQLRSIYKKLGVNSRSEAVRTALRFELLHPGHGATLE